LRTTFHLTDVRTLVGRALTPRTKWQFGLMRRRMVARVVASPVGPLIKPLLMRPYLRRPEEVDIEVTSSCDADCIMCPRKRMSRNPGPMALPLFRKIVDEAVSLGVRELVLNGYGEISTLRNYRDYLGYIRERSRSIRIVVNTNGMRMREEIASAYVEFGVDLVNIAIDGATPETFESIRKDLKLDTVEANVRQLIAIRNAAHSNRPFILVNMIYMPENAHETDLFLEKWTGVADHAGIVGMVSRVGSVPAPIVNRSLKSKPVPCFLPWRQLPILSDGTVALCCDDWNGQANLGNIADHSIEEIWHNHQRRNLRRLHMEGQAGEIDLCRVCQDPRPPPPWF
jgi:radical SAM protein with 4Fe4S-binding SPASM domain